MGRKGIDLTGQRFGKWNVLREAEERGKSRKVLWECICDCGTHKNVQTWSLTSGASSSCGCKNKLNLTGKKFGKLTVMRLSCEDIRDGTSWVCLCDCGNETTIVGASLTSGNSKSCGCSKKLSLTGERFGKWTVLDLPPEKNSKRNYVWKCICDCGTERMIVGTRLTTGRTTHCGCSLGLDLVGKRFNRFLVIGKCKTRDNHGRVMWKCECECGNMRNVSTNDLRRGSTKSCGCIQIRDLKGQRFGKLTVLRMTGERSHGSVVWECICECGNITAKLSNHLVNLHTASCGCMTRGENHHSYNHDITDEERMENRYQLYGVNMHNWRKEIFSNDDFTCQACDQRGSTLNAHHLNSWNAFPEQRFDTANGITLCEDCHKEYHYFNGYGDNTIEEFRDHIACMIGEEYLEEVEETLLSRESLSIETRELQTT